MSPDRTLALTSRCAQVLTSNFTNSNFVLLLDDLLSVVTRLEPGQTSEWSSQHLNTLIRLRSAHSLSNLDRVLAQAIKGGLPYGQTGFPDLHAEDNLGEVLRHAQARWVARSVVLEESIDLRPLFSTSGDTFSRDVSSIFEGLIYRSRKARDLFLDWLKHTPEQWSSLHICRPLHAYLDTFDDGEPTEFSEGDEEVLAEVCSTVVRQAFGDASANYDSSAISCGQRFLLCSRFKKNRFVEAVRRAVDALNVDHPHEGVIRFGASLGRHICAEFHSLFESIIKHVLNSLVRYLSDATTLDTKDESRLQLICQYCDAFKYNFRCLTSNFRRASETSEPCSKFRSGDDDYDRHSAPLFLASGDEFGRHCIQVHVPKSAHLSLILTHEFH